MRMLFSIIPEGYDTQFLFVVRATGHWKCGEYVIVLLFSLYMLSLSFFGECVIAFQSQPCVTNPASILYISPRTDKHTQTHTHTYIIYYNQDYTIIPEETTGLATTVGGHPLIPPHIWHQGVFASKLQYPICDGYGEASSLQPYLYSLLDLIVIVLYCINKQDTQLPSTT